MEEIVNKIADSGLINLSLEDLHQKGPRLVFDLKPLLFEELILKEKDFRESLKNTDWTLYQNAFVAICCTADAIVPTWAYMLVASYLEPVVKKLVFGDKDYLESVLFHEAIAKMDVAPFDGGRIIIKGCSKVKVPESAFVELLAKLRPHAQSIFYGEACSTVPLYKKK